MHLAIHAHDDPHAIALEAKRLVESLDLGAGVLVLTDIYGATPCNIACRLLVPGRVEGVAGASLPMLMRVLTYRNEPLEALVQRAISGGRDGVARMPCPESEKCSIERPKS
jgi:PTS system ascorbate-specific IIA component